MDRRGRLGSHGVMDPTAAHPLQSPGRGEPFPTGVWMPPTRPWGGAPFPDHLRDTMQAWSSGPLNRHRVGQRGSSLELTSRHLPLEGTASWRGGPPACHHTLLPHRGHTPCLLPPSWGRCCPFLHSREGVHRSPARCPVPRVPEQGISLPAEVTIANICLAFHAFHLTKSSQHTQQGASVIPTGRMVSDLPMSTQVRGEAGPSGAPTP